MSENTPKSKAFGNDSGAAEYISRALNSDSDAAYAKGWDDAEEAFRGKIADLLERSGRERAELEESVELLTWGLKFYAAPENWYEDHCQCCDQELTSKAYWDAGDTARQAFHALGLDERQKEEGNANS